MVCSQLDAFRTSNQHSPVIFHGFPRFWEPSPDELPSKLERVSEPARSEDLEDFNRVPMHFPKIANVLRTVDPQALEPGMSKRFVC